MKKGDNVKWNWGKSKAGGKIKQEFDKPVVRTIKGTEVKRNASKEEPAFLVEQENGSVVLKSGSELTKEK